MEAPRNVAPAKSGRGKNGPSRPGASFTGFFRSILAPEREGGDFVFLGKDSEVVPRVLLRPFRASPLRDIHPGFRFAAPLGYAPAPLRGLECLTRTSRNRKRRRGRWRMRRVEAANRLLTRAAPNLVPESSATFDTNLMM